VTQEVSVGSTARAPAKLMQQAHVAAHGAVIGDRACRRASPDLSVFSPRLAVP
jgi:hypothetical protein